MILIKGLIYVFLACVERIVILKACDLRHEISRIQGNIWNSGNSTTKFDLCDHVCKINESTLNNCKPNSCPIKLFIVVENLIYLFNVTDKPGTNTIQITCEIKTASCDNNSCDGNNSSSSGCILEAQQTTSASLSDNTFGDVTEAATGTTKVTSKIERTSKSQISLTTKIQEETTTSTTTTRPATTSDESSTTTTVRNKTVSQACECSLNSGLVVGAAFIGLLVGVITTGPISIFLYKRLASPNKGRTISNSIYELNETKTTVRPTVGDTYNEIENEPEIPKILYVLPITKDQAKSSIKTNDPEIYHHLREDFNVKDRSNSYDHAMPLNGPQEVESEHYGKLTIEENGAYSTVTNTNKTGPDQVRNEAYSSKEFQLVEDNSKANSASYFVLVKD